MAHRLGIDIGGTFTDFTLLDEDSGRVVAAHKLPSTPAEPLRAVQAGLDRLQALLARSGSLGLVLHGTTVGLNALVTGSEPPPGLLTTRGFRDVYELGRQGRGGRLYDFFIDPPPRLTSRRLVREVGERLDAEGREVEALDLDGALAAVEQLLAQGVRSLAICFLFAYMDAAHERAVAAGVRDRHPEVYVSLSSEVNPQFREYERTATTVANAYLGPRVSRYLTEMDAFVQASHPGTHLLIMQSNGGVGTPAAMARAPVRTLMSGPVAGVVGARYLGDLLGWRDLLTIDVGGTSCDLSVVPGQVLLTGDTSLAGHVIRVPSVDVETLGSGGGSIARVVAGRTLRVGPESAGAAPGPACYGAGGEHATLTDALVVLGHLSGEALLGGRMPIRADLAREAVRVQVAEPLGLDVSEAAEGIVRLLVSQVAASIRTITIERGYDPRHFVLVAFGGAGPTIAGRLAGELGIQRVLIPQDPGNFCSFGMLLTDLVADRARTRIARVDEVDWEDVRRSFGALESEAEGDLAGVPAHRVVVERFWEMRYPGESSEVLVPVGPMDDPSSRERAVDAFHETHARLFGHVAREQPVEIVQFRVRYTALIPKPALPRLAPAGAAVAEDARVGTRRICFPTGGGWTSAPVLRRERLGAGSRLSGPVVVEEDTSTTVVGPADTAEVDPYGNLILSIASSGGHPA